MTADSPLADFERRAQKKWTRKRRKLLVQFVEKIKIPVWFNGRRLETNINRPWYHLTLRSWSTIHRPWTRQARRARYAYNAHSALPTLVYEEWHLHKNKIYLHIPPRGGKWFNRKKVYNNFMWFGHNVMYSNVDILCLRYTHIHIVYIYSSNKWIWHHRPPLQHFIFSTHPQTQKDTTAQNLIRAHHTSCSVGAVPWFYTKAAMSRQTLTVLTLTIYITAHAALFPPSNVLKAKLAPGKVN